MAQDVRWLPLLVVSVGAALGVALLSYALQGYLPGIGALPGTLAGFAVRGCLVVAGLLMAAPEPVTDLVGLVPAAVTYGGLLGAPRLRRALGLRPA